jgi:CRISPR/Cas system CSM-associated protein Csm4 (group 5 of RAMP superfamily)
MNNKKSVSTECFENVINEFNKHYGHEHHELLKSIQAADIDIISLMKSCEQSPEFMKEEDLKPDGFPITD